MIQGTVYKSTGSWYLVKSQDKFFECRIKGKIRLKDISTTNPIAVGDLVMFDLENDGKGIISDILPRTNYIIRKSVNLSKQRHIIASNIDISVLVVTLNNPNTSSNFIDRFLVSCQAYDIPVIIAFNKIDSYSDCELISAKYGNGIDELIELMKSKTCIISGHSGVGKSTLINSISPKLRLKTKEISSSHNQGKHTTTYAEMFDLDANIRVIDTPGIRGFGLVDISKYELGDFFPEFLLAKQKCKFNNCVHLDEPDCNVKKKIEDGDIFESRYLTYLDMLKDQNIYRKPDESSNTES